MESQSNDQCAHLNMKWFETMVFNEEGQGHIVRIYSCPDCGERGRA